MTTAPKGCRSATTTMTSAPRGKRLALALYLAGRGNGGTS
jgi:hypothetical protein